jgi:hypothetical protein
VRHDLVHTQNRSHRLAPVFSREGALLQTSSIRSETPSLSPNSSPHAPLPLTDPLPAPSMALAILPIRIGSFRQPSPPPSVTSPTFPAPLSGSSSSRPVTLRPSCQTGARRISAGCETLVRVKRHRSQYFRERTHLCTVCIARRSHRPRELSFHDQLDRMLDRRPTIRHSNFTMTCS